MLIHIDDKNSERISFEIFSMYVDKDKRGKEKCVICDWPVVDDRVCKIERIHRIQTGRQTQTHANTKI